MTDCDFFIRPGQAHNHAGQKIVYVKLPSWLCGFDSRHPLSQMPKSEQLHHLGIVAHRCSAAVARHSDWHCTASHPAHQFRSGRADRIISVAPAMSNSLGSKPGGNHSFSSSCSLCEGSLIAASKLP